MEFPDALQWKSSGNTVKDLLLAALRRTRTVLKVLGKKRFLISGKDLHLGANVRLWAPDRLTIGDNVYIGKDSLIECNATIGNHCLIANRVAFVGRHDHDFRQIGIPIRFSPWIGDSLPSADIRQEEVVVCDDVWIGYGAILLTGITVGRGAIVASGSVVTKDVEPYAVVAGNPARTVGERFKRNGECRQHEAAVEQSQFIVSEKGFRYCKVIQIGS